MLNMKLDSIRIQTYEFFDAALEKLAMHSGAEQSTVRFYGFVVI